VIRSFKDKRAEALYRGDTVAELQAIRAAVLRKLDMLDAQPGSRISGHRLATASKRSRVAGRASTASGSTIGGASASCGAMRVPNWSRSSITIEE
jgi:hypothetical protein